MNELLQETLLKAGFESYYITRLAESVPCIVYNYIVRPCSHSDNKLESMEYTVLLNLYINKDIQKSQEAVLNSMLETGFRLIQVQEANLESNNVFNIAFKFKKILEVERMI